jgi:hypothetical protein
MMAAGLLQRAAASLPRHQRALPLAIVIAVSFAAEAAAQTDTTAVPEQPSWTNSPASSGGANSGTSASSAPSLGIPAPPQSTGTATAPTAAPAPLTVTQAGAPQAWQRNASSAGGASTVGVPDTANNNLPNFRENSYGQAWFERSGLKFRVGPVNLRMSLNLATEYNDNILASNTDIEGDIVQVVTPQFILGMGDFQQKDEDYATLSYQPSLNYYDFHPNENRVNQTLDIAAKETFSRYSTTLDLSYVNNNQSTATQSGLNAYQIFQFAWNNSYYLGGKTFVQLNASASNQHYESPQETYNTVTVNPALGYEYSPKTTITFGPFAGTTYIKGGGTQSFQGLNLGVTWSNLKKLTFNGTIGVQAQQFNGQNLTGASNFVTPVFDLGAGYKPFINTQLGLDLSRNVQLSNGIQGQTYTNSQLEFNASQLIFQKLTLSLALTYQHLQYQGSGPSRLDNYWLVVPSIGYHFWRDTCFVSVYYRRQQRDSNQQTFGYMVNAYGIQFTYNF